MTRESSLLSSGVRSRPALPVRSFFEVIENVPGAWYFVRPNGSFAFVNSEAAAALGYTTSELAALTIFDVDPNLDRTVWAGLWQTPCVTGGHALRSTHRRRDGSLFPVEVRGGRVLMDGEELSVTYVLDLSISEGTRSSLIETEARLRRLIDNLPDLVFRLRVGPRPAFEFLSPSATALLGVDPAQLTRAADGFEQLIHPEDAVAFLSLAQRSSRSYERVRFAHRSGRWIWMDVRVSVLTSQSGACVLEGVARDVSDSHEADLSNRRLLAAIEQTTDAVVVTDVDGRVVYCNPAYGRAVNSAPQAVIGKSWLALDADAAGEFGAAAARAFAQGQQWRGEVRGAHRSGAPSVTDATISPIRGDAGQLIGCVAVKRDLTERKRLEGQLRQAQKMETVGHLAGGMAHDFNNVLHVIQGHAQLLGELMRDSPHQRMVEEILGATERATRLVSQLLAFSRRETVEVSVMQLDRVVDSVCDMLAPLLGEQILLQRTNCVAAPRVRGSVPQIEQVVANLCLNARDAMPTGGVLEISIRVPESDALAAAGLDAAAADFVELCVRDEGEGMSPDTQARLFEPLFTTKERGKGTGLGLATASAIVRAHGGAIAVRSERGQGSQFRVFLPLSHEASAPQTLRARPARIDGAGRWVLLVEDDPSVRSLTAEYLRRLGFQVDTSSDGAEAEATLLSRQRDYSLLVVDAVMPKKSGRQLLESLREAGLSLPTILVTGYPNEIREDVGVASYVLGKPFSSDQLTAAVGTVIGPASLRGEVSA